MELSDKEMHNCLTAVFNEGRIPMYFLFSQDIPSHNVQMWLLKSGYIKITSETMFILKFMGRNWEQKSPVPVRVPLITMKGLWKIWTLREKNKDFDENFVDYDDIRLK
jgi:hypothetical protein